MRLKLLVSTAAVVCLAWPAAALADPPADQNHGDASQNQSQKPEQAKGHGQGGQGAPQGKPATQGAPAGQGRLGPGVPSVGQGAARTQGESNPQGQFGRQEQGAAKGVQAQAGSQSGQAGVGSTVGPRSAPVGAPFQGAQTLQGNGPNTAQVRQPPHPPANVPALSGWNHNATGAARTQAGQQWRQAHSGWDNNAPWRRSSNWWRGNDAFRLFSGVRDGFFFIPGLGYIAAPGEYWGRTWQAGDYLPNWFWRYTIDDYWDYGLPQPPDGCAWVWVNDDVALIDLSDGYILDIEHNAW